MTRDDSGGAKLAVPYRGKSDIRDVWNASMLRWARYEGELDMPVMPVCDAVPEKITPFPEAISKKADDSFIHFFMDDYKFERIWRMPRRYLSIIKKYGGAIAPDFSVFREMPLIQQAGNIFKGRVLGQWWAKNGVPVIPVARWGDERSLRFCFDGLPKKSVIAIGTHGCTKRKDDRRYFHDGFYALLDRLEPKTIVVYGSASDRLIPPLFTSNVNIVQFESKFSLSRIREAV
jgi:hypothetical protein